MLKKHLRVWGKSRYNTLPLKDKTYIQNLKTVIIDLFINLNATDNMILVHLLQHSIHLLQLQSSSPSIQSSSFSIQSSSPSI